MIESKLKLPSRRRVSDEVAAILADTIFDQINSSYRPGTQIREVTTARELGVSRDSLRQALLVLAAEGLVNILPHRGAFVAGVSSPLVREVYRVRKVLELGAVENFRTDQKEALALMEECVGRMREAQASGSFGHFLDADLDFHKRLVATHQSELIDELYARVSTKLKLCIAVGHSETDPNKPPRSPSPGDSDEAAAHERLVAHLRAHETRQASELLRRTLTEDEIFLLGRVTDSDVA